jgi:hypothetical protein
MRIWFLMLMLLASGAKAQTIETFTGPNGERCTRSTDMHGQTREECEKKAPERPATSTSEQAPTKPTPAPPTPPTVPAPPK